MQASEITHVSWWLGRGPNPAAFRTLFVEPFNEATDDVTIDLVELGDDAHGTLLAALDAGTGPDILVVPRTGDFVTMVRAGRLLPLDVVAARLGWHDRLLAAPLALGSVDGQLFGVPRSLETMPLFYDRALFAAHGWEPPTDLGSLEALASAMLQHGIVPFGAGSGDFPGSCEWFVSLILNHAAGPTAVRQALVGDLPWTAPAFERAMALLVQWFARGWFGDDYFRQSALDGFSMIADGSAGLSPTLTWAFEPARELFAGREDDLGAVPFPAVGLGVPAPLHLLGTASLLGVNAASEHPDAAARVLDALFRPAVRRAFAADVPGDWNLPLADPDALGLGAVATPQFADTAVGLIEAALAGRFGYATWTFLPPAAEAATIDDFRPLVDGTLSPADYLARVDEAFRRDRSAGRAVTIP